MAENRTFHFMGQGYGSEPVNITASINSTQIYSGPIPTITGPAEPYPVVVPVDQVILFSIDNSALLSTDFAGSLPMTVVVSGGTGVLLGTINSNWTQGDYASLNGQPDQYGGCYIGQPPNSDGSGDVRSSVNLNGTPWVIQRPPDGYWNYYVTTDNTLTYNFNISLGQVGNVVGNVSSYAGPYTTTAPSW